MPHHAEGGQAGDPNSTVSITVENDEDVKASPVSLDDALLLRGHMQPRLGESMPKCRATAGYSSETRLGSDC